MLSTAQILEPYSKGQICPPELYNRPVPNRDLKPLKIAIRLYMRQLRKYEEQSQEMYKEMRMWVRQQKILRKMDTLIRTNMHTKT